MKKIGIIVKETSENHIKKSVKDSESIFVVNYSGLSSPDLTSLRKTLAETKSRLFVVKNTVARRAMKECGLDGVIKSIEGPCGLVFGQDEPVVTSKVLYTFAKSHEKMVLAGGCIKDRVLETKDIEVLAKLPGKDQLRAMVVCALNAPIAALARVLNGNLQKLVYALDQVKQKKDAGGGQ